MDARPVRGSEVEPSSDSSTSFTFSYTAEAVAHSIDELPQKVESEHLREQQHPVQRQSGQSGEYIPLEVFALASTMQAACRFLVDTRGLTFTATARLLNRTPKSIWASYHQIQALPILTLKEGALQIPVEIFCGVRSPLEALVCYLRNQGLRNKAIAAALRLDPRTTSTVAKRGEARR